MARPLTNADLLPDVRDGLTAVERIVLDEMGRIRDESGGRPVSTVLLYTRVVDRIELSRDAFVAVLQRLGAADHAVPGRRR